MVATALMAAGTAMSAISMYQQGKAAEAQARGQAALNAYNARVYNQTAKAIEAKTKFDQIRHQRYGRRVMGSLRARLGASGAVMTEGAPLAVQADQAYELALENALIGYEGMVKAGQARSAAGVEQFKGGYAMARAKAARAAGILGAGTTLLSDFGQMKYEGVF